MGVTIGPGSIIGTQGSGASTTYQWSFSANVNGAQGVFTFWYPNANYSEAAEYAQVYLEENPDALGGISFNDGNPGDPTQDPGDYPGQDPGDPGQDRNDDDGMLADGATGDDSDDSV